MQRSKFKLQKILLSRNIPFSELHLLLRFLSRHFDHILYSLGHLLKKMNFHTFSSAKIQAWLFQVFLLLEERGI